MGSPARQPRWGPVQMEWHHGLRLAERCLLDGLEVHQRLVVVGDGADLVGSLRREITLCLENEEARLDAGGEFLLSRLEPPLRQLARDARGVDTLLVRLHPTPDFPHLR